MKQCPFCAGVIPDASTVCKHCKQAIPSARAGGRKAMPLWVVGGVGLALVAVGAPAVLLLRTDSHIGAANEEGRRANLVQGLLAARAVADQKTLCESPTAVADAWHKLQDVRRDDPEWEYAAKLAATLETCRSGIARRLASSLSELRRRQRLDRAETVRRTMQTQGFDTRVAIEGAASDEVRIASPQLTPALVDRLTAGLSMEDGSFLESWQKLGCVRVTFSDGRRRWAYELPRTQEAYQDVSVLTGMGLGEPLALP